MKQENKPQISTNVFVHKGKVSRQHREMQNGHRGVILWFTGLSGAGKSTLAHAIEEQLHQMNCRAYVLDGDNLRHGLCGDLGFSLDDRTENIRRVSEIAKLFLDVGIIVLSAFISPFSKDRDSARSMFAIGDFFEIYCECPIDVCESRDAKGIYKLARAGLISDFTGVSSPYEAPGHPELIVNTAHNTIEKCAQQVIDILIQHKILERPPVSG